MSIQKEKITKRLTKALLIDKDIEWSHIDLKKMNNDVDKLMKEEKRNDIIYSFGLFKFIVFPFAICFPKLVLAMFEHLDEE